jgi:hypothetical protein
LQAWLFYFPGAARRNQSNFATVVFLMASERKPAVTFSAKILEQLTKVEAKVEESLEQGRANGYELKMLRRELGLDGQHGRLPLVETALTRHELRMDKSDARIEHLEVFSSEAVGKAKLVGATLALLGGSAGGTVIALVMHLLGLR